MTISAPELQTELLKICRDLGVLRARVLTIAAEIRGAPKLDLPISRRPKRAKPPADAAEKNGTDADACEEKDQGN